MCTNFSPHQNGLSLNLHQRCEWSAVNKVVLLPDSALIDDAIYHHLIRGFLLFLSESLPPRGPPLLTLVRSSHFNEKFKITPFIKKTMPFSLDLIKNKVISCQILAQTISCLMNRKLI